jgi:hypothetical protein
MALSGVHVVFGFVQKSGKFSNLFGAALWSETIASDGVTEQSATFGMHGSPAFSIRAALDVFVSIGKQPDASVSPRHFVPAGEWIVFPCFEGDRLAWTAA